MSIVYCSYCNKGIDTDFDAEHFVDEDMEDCIIKEQYNEELTSDLDNTFRNLNQPL